MIKVLVGRVVILVRPLMFACWRKPAPHSQTIVSQYGVTVMSWGTPQWAGEGARRVKQHAAVSSLGPGHWSLVGFAFRAERHIFLYSYRRRSRTNELTKALLYTSVFIIMTSAAAAAAAAAAPSTRRACGRRHGGRSASARPPRRRRPAARAGRRRRRTGRSCDR
jgi:hypothetical protein